MDLLDRFLNWVRNLFNVTKYALAWTLAISAIALLAYAFLYDVIEAVRECWTVNVFSNCVENKLRDL